MTLIVGTWLLAATISAAMGLLQYFLLADGLSPWLGQPSLGTAFANLQQRNQFATLTSIGLVALIGWLAVQVKTSGRHAGDQFPWWAKYVAVLLALGNAASSSRTGFLQWAMILTLTAWWLLPHRRSLVMFALRAMLAYMFASLVLPWLLGILTGSTTAGLVGRFSDGAACSSRTVLWSNVLTMIAQKPWLGWGWGELKYAHYVTSFQGARFCEMMGNAHNLPLHLAVTLGIPASILASGGFVWWVRRQTPWRETDPARQLAWGVIAVILLHSLVEYPLWYGPFQIAVGLCFWILLRSAPQTGIQPHYLQTASPFMKVGRLSIPVILVTTSIYAGWDYHRVSQLYLAPTMRDARYREDTLAKVGHSWLFANQVRFAELGRTPLTNENAEALYDSASKLLHFSPEPRVVEQLIESGLFMKKDLEAVIHLDRYRLIYPTNYGRWLKKTSQISAAPQVD